ncbi:MAG: hypothetical protein DRI36_01100 [Caldiserica bacterium]|nr:MAG: hypothetical protein DRI36_01100 [Caldisericota bacterium]
MVILILFLAMLLSETTMEVSTVTAKAHLLSGKIDDFENDGSRWDQNLVPDASWWDDGIVATFTYVVVSTLSHSGKYSLELTYKKGTGAEWEYFNCTDLTDTFGNNHDFSVSASSSISMWIYSVESSSSTNNIDIFIKFKDENGTESGDIGTQVTTSSCTWQKLIWNWDSSKIGSCDIKNIREILIFPEPGDANVEGKFYIDDVFLEAPRE